MSLKSDYGQPKENYHAKIIAKSAAIFAVCVLLTLICLVPIYILIVNSTHNSMDLAQNPSRFWFGSSLGDNFKTLMNNLPQDATKTMKRVATQYHNAFNVGQGYLNSLIIAGSTTFLTVFFAAMTAYGLTVYEFKLNSAAYTFIIAVMMIPVQVSSAGFVRFMYSLHLINNFIPLIVPAIAAPVTFFYLKQYMDSNLPHELLEAARIDGAGEVRIFNTVALPLMRPAIAVQAIFTFVSSWNNYFTPSLILHKDKAKTLPILIAQLRAADWLKFDMGQVYAMIAFSIFPVIIVYLILSKNIVGGVSAGAVKG